MTRKLPESVHHHDVGLALIDLRIEERLAIGSNRESAVEGPPREIGNDGILLRRNIKVAERISRAAFVQVLAIDIINAVLARIIPQKFCKKKGELAYC